MAARNISIRLSDEKIEKIDALAKALGRSRAWVVNEATDRYLEYEAWFSAKIEHGMADVSSGRVKPHDEVMAAMRDRLSRSGE